MNKQRRHFAGTEKVAILKRHLLEKVPIRPVRDEFDIYPNQLYGWLKEFFENGHAAFDNGRKSKAVEEAKDKKIEKLEAKRKDSVSVLAELMERRAAKKKSWGKLTGRWTPHDTRDTVVDFVRTWSDKTDIPVCLPPGSASAPASSTTGSNASARSTSTTPGCPAIIGSPKERRTRSHLRASTSSSKVIGA